MKRTIAVFLTRIFCAALLFSCFAGVSPAAEGQTTSDYEYTADGERGIIITRYTGKGGEVTVPEQIDGKPVIGIHTDAFRENTAVTGIVLPNTLETIGKGAFVGCTSLRSLSLPFVGTEKAQPGQFYDLFMESSSIFSIPKSLETVTLRGGELQYGAFREAAYVKKIVLGPEIDEIGVNAFSGCTGLEEIVLPDGLTKIQSRAFWNCARLSSISLPAGVNLIGRYAFEGCTALEKIEIHKDNKAFLFENGGLYNRQKNYLYFYSHVGTETTYTLPDTLAYIEPGVFSRVARLTHIATTENNPYFTAQDGVLYDKKQTTLFVYPCGKTASKAVVPDGVRAIDEQAFFGNTHLTEVVLPESLTNLGAYCFRDCSSLVSMRIPEKITSLPDGIFFANSSLKEVILPSGLKKIGYNSFTNCTALEKIEIPGKVTQIGAFAFTSCTSLKTVVLPDSLKSLGMGVFGNCTALVEITIPDQVTEISDQAFSNCINLKRVTVPSGIRVVGKDAFYRHNPGLTIWGYAGSAMEQYAKENNISFAYREEDPHEEDPHEEDPHEEDPHKEDPHEEEPREEDPREEDPREEDPREEEPREEESLEITGHLRLTISRQAGKTVLIATPVVFPKQAKIKYRWLADGAVIAETESNIYTLLPKDFGRTFSVRAKGIFPYKGEIIGPSLKTLRKAVSVSVARPPFKREYDIGERWKPYDMLLEVTYSDGSTEQIAQGFTVKEFDSDTEGEKTVELLYGGLTAKMALSVRCRHSGATERDGDRELCRICGRQTEPKAEKNGRAAALLTVGRVPAIDSSRPVRSLPFLLLTSFSKFIAEK